MANEREHDVVVFGATGFAGKLTAAYLAGAAPNGTRIALGGRSRDKLERTRDELGLDWPVVTADSGDAQSLEALARSTKAIATPVGPYLRYRFPLGGACAGAGLHFARRRGEPLFLGPASSVPG